MAASAYTILALAMRYFFLAGLLFVLLQLVLQSIGEYRELRRVKQQASGVYTRSIVFVDPAELRGVRYALQRENDLGSGKSCGIRLLYRGMKRRQAHIYRSGEADWIALHGKKGVYYNGTPVKARAFELKDGDILELHGVRFLFQRKESLKAEENHE